VTKKTINPDDLALFRQSIGQVKPIKADKVILQPEPKPKPSPKTKAVNLEAYLQPTTPDASTPLGSEDTLSYSAVGLQKNVLRRLRQGYFGLDAEIDLHGLSSQVAKQQLLHFLHLGVENGWRCVHIIHGKGYRSADNQPVLKNHLNSWLRQHQNVLAFCSATQRHGGAGAVMVLLQVAEKYGDEEEFWF
jgi:DNA-nicking Smr family endonuclease